MTDTSIRIASDTRDKLRAEKRGNETYTEVIDRLLEAAGDRSILSCSECGEAVRVYARDADGNVLCFDCAGIDRDEVRFVEGDDSE